MGGQMKKIIASLMTVLFLGSTGLVWADAAGGPVKTVKHHKGGKGKKKKVAINPQPLPPRKAPPRASSGVVNKAQ
jgi:hypothetical protein